MDAFVLIMRFIGRERELEFLEDQWNKTGASFVPIYGKRRVGKSRLIVEFIQGKDHAYHLANQESANEQVNSFKGSLSQALDDKYLRDNYFGDWKQLFRYLEKNIPKDKKIVLAIDEVTYIIKRDPSFPSNLQNFWDTFLKDTEIMLILCGSLIGLMKESILEYSSPLYGRRSGQIHLKPLKASELGVLIKDRDKLVRLYSVMGGVPRYYELIDMGEDFSEIVDKILSPESAFFEEGIFLMGQEFKELGNYNSILKSMSRGNTELSDIANDIGIESRKLSNYMDNLYAVGMIRKEKPVTNTQKRYRGYRYHIKDNFLDFWFKFIFPNRGQIEERVLSYHDISDELNHFTAKKFEDICKQEMAKGYGKVGTWWHDGQEIDLVGLDERERTIGFAECKWTNEPVGKAVYHSLKEKSRSVRWHEDRTEKFYIFSRSGFTDELKETEDVVLHDLSFLVQG